MDVFVGSFSANSGTGNQTVSGIVDAAGNAFTPKAVMLITGYNTAAGFQDGWRFSFGLTDGTTSAAISTYGQDNTAGATVRTVVSTDFFRQSDTVPTILRQGAFVSFGSGEFTVNWTTASGNQTILFVAFGGADLDAAVVSRRQDGVDTAVAPGFTPAAQIALGCASFLDLFLSVGFLGNEDGSMGQGTSMPVWNSGSNPTQAARTQRTDRLFAAPNTTGSAVQTLGGLDAIGTFFEVLNVDSKVLQKNLLLGGIAAKCGSLLQPAATGTQAVSGVGFEPKAVFFITIGNTALTGTTLANDAQLCLGVADRTRQGYVVSGSTDNVATSVCVSKYDTSKVIAAFTPNATAASTTTEAEASVQSIDADGFTLNWTTADATAREVVWLALGDASGGAGGGAHAHTFFG
jgi:hypothetical protein